MAFKPDKRLRWLPHLGSVQLEIELKDRKLDVQVSPLEAAIVELFSAQSMFITLCTMRLLKWRLRRVSK